MKYRAIFAFCLLLSATGCATQSFSFLYKQKPSMAQGHELIGLISNRLVSDFGFSKLPNLSFGNTVFERRFDATRIIKVQLKEGEYPLVYFTVPKSQQDSRIVSDLVQMIQHSYVDAGLPAPVGPAFETWFGI